MQEKSYISIIVQMKESGEFTSKNKFALNPLGWA